MRNLFRLLLSVYLISIADVLFSQTHFFSVWNNSGKLINSGNIDFSKTDDFIQNMEMKDDSIFVLYLGLESIDSSNYSFNASDFNIENYVSLTICSCFFPKNDSLIPSSTAKDTILHDLCIKYRTNLPDGTWIRIIKDSTGRPYKEALKNTKHGLIDGSFYCWHANGNVFLYAQFDEGIVHFINGYDKNGCHLSREIFDCNIKIESFAYDCIDSTLSFYYNFNKGFISNFRGEIITIAETYKGVLHGNYYKFDLKWNKVTHKKYYYGQLIH